MGCQESPSPISEADPVAQPLLSDFTAHLLTPSAFSGNGLSKAERSFIAKHSVDDQRKMSELIQQADSWEEAHQGMMDFLAESSELPDFIREQRAAVFMLKRTRSLGELSDVHREGMAVYVDLLAEYRSPEAALMLESLQKLKGFLPEEKIRYAASRSVEGADVYLNMKYYCDECPAAKLAASSDHSVVLTQDVFIKELLGSVDVLRLLSEPPQG